MNRKEEDSLEFDEAGGSVNDSGAEDEAAAMMDSKKGNDTITGMKSLSASKAPVTEFQIVDDSLNLAEKSNNQKRESQIALAQPADFGKQAHRDNAAGKVEQPVTRDAEGRVTNVRYPDGTSREFRYAANELSQIIKYDKSGKEVSRIETSQNSATRYQVKTDGTLEARHHNVQTVNGEAFYDRQGKQIGQRVSEFRELTVVKSERPDGSQGVRREYPGGGSREVFSKDGKTFEYTFTGADGSKDVWHRDGKSDDWHRATDIQKKHLWAGSIEMKEDGRLLEQEKSTGKITEVSKDGQRDVYPDKEIWRNDLLALSEKKIADKAGQEQFRNYINTIEERVKSGKLSTSQAAESYKDIYRMMSAKSQAGVSDEHMVILGRQTAHNIAKPDGVDQGPYGNCNTSSPEVRLYTKEPATMTRLLADAAITGKYTDKKGTTIDISESLKPADAVHTKVPHGENERSYASQLFHLVGVGLELKANFPNLNLRYVQQSAKPGDNGDRVMDYSKNPPKEVYEIKDGKPVHESRPVLLPNGKQALDANLQPLVTKPLGNPGLTIQNSINMMEKITGKQEVGAAIGHFNSVGQSILFWGRQKDARIPYFTNEEDLGNLLAKLKSENKLPAVLEVNSGSGFLRKQVEEAAGKTMGGEGGMFGGGHVLCIKDYNSHTKKVEVDNTWGSSRDKLAENSVSLKDVLDISQADPKLVSEAKQYKAHIQGAYAVWCRDNGKTMGKDFPSPEEGKAFFEKYRQLMRKREQEHSGWYPLSSF